MPETAVRTDRPTHRDGAHWDGAGVRFSIASRHATRVELCLFETPEQAHESERVALRRDGAGVWSAYLPGRGPGQLYGYRIDGPYDPASGHLFNPAKLLVDPAALALTGGAAWNRALLGQRRGSPRTALSRDDLDSAPFAPRGVVVDTAFDWRGDRPPATPWSESLIYEAHVKGLTRLPPEVPRPLRGTYLGLAEPVVLEHLQSLGVTAVELLPVFQFTDERHLAEAGRGNYWGYSPIGFFAPHAAYATASLGRQVSEFKEMVRRLHAAGLEVILDVVYNHTAEGGAGGPAFCFRGLAEETYYLLDAGGGYLNFSGTGNTLNTQNAVVRRLILDSLRYWVEEMHVDGFRFDLASILSRDQKGRPMEDPPILWTIESEPSLAGTKLIAEAWDAGGLYQVGSFVGDRFLEWNGRFRDDVRAFVKGDPGSVPRLAARLFASPDVYAHEAREAQQSVNFVTCHDGFTLNDLVSYNRKHNEANGEDNRDGTDHNLSWNCGVEGPSDDPEIEALRRRQIRNLLTVNLLALGTPMLLAGDEMRRTQGGNNNPYCQDNEISWLDWTLLERHRDLHRFVRSLIRLRRRLGARGFDWTLPLEQLLQQVDVRWHGVRLDQPDRGRHSRTLALQVTGPGRAFVLYAAFNAYWRPLEFELPPPGESLSWRRVIDTSLESPDDFRKPEEAPAVEGPDLQVTSRSVVVLLAG